jgi:hypothetical protein
MANDEINPNDETRMVAVRAALLFVIRASLFVRHLSFAWGAVAKRRRVLRHS